MDRIENYRIKTNQAAMPAHKKAESVNFGATDTRKLTQITSPSNVTSDYNVTTPMPYKFIEDIKLSDNLTAKYYKLANGQKVIIVPKDGETIVKTYVNTGSMNEPDNVRGISHYIEHNLFNGSESLGDKVFFDEVHKMGAYTNASTYFSTTNYFISSNLLDDKDLENQIKLHAGMLQTPKFMIDKLEKEKKIVNQEINMCLSNDENIGFSETLKNLFNIKSTSIDLVAGSTDNITALTRDDVVNYFNNNYYPANMTTVITGEVNPDETMQLISKYFTSRKAPVQNRHYEKMTPTQTPVRRDIISNKSQGGATVFVGFAGAENADYKDRTNIEALATVLTLLANSRLSVLENKYAANVYFSAERLGTRPTDRQMLLFNANVTDENVEMFLKEFYAKIADIAQNPISDDELTAVKSKLKKDYINMIECSGGINHLIGTEFLNSSQEALTKNLEIIDKMTSQDLLDAAKKYFDLNKVSITVVHPSETKLETIDENYKKASQVSFTGANKKAPINTANIVEYRMPNNFSVLINENNSENAEYRFEISNKQPTPKKAAIADILSQMLGFGGTQNKNIAELSKELDKYAIAADVFAGSYGLFAAGDFPIENTKKALELFNEKILTPDLSQKTFDEAKKRCRDSYSTHQINAFDKYDKAMYEGLPLAITTEEKLNSLDEITLEDVKQFYNEIFEKGQGTLTVSGAFAKHPEDKNEIFKKLNEFKPVQPKDTSIVDSFKPVEKTQVYTNEYKKNQAHILEGFKFKHPGNIKDTICLSLLEEILGGSTSSRLFTDLRETRHLAYTVKADFEPVDNNGIMTLITETTTENKETGEQTFDNIEKAINCFNENVEKIRTEKVTPRELEEAKKSLKGQMLSELETNSDKTNVIHSISKSPYGVEYVNQKLAIIDSITPDDILNTAKYVFKEKPIYSIAATKASLDANEEFLNKLKEE